MTNSALMQTSFACVGEHFPDPLEPCVFLNEKTQGFIFATKKGDLKMLYHFHSQIIGRGKGQSVVAASAYRATENITDRTTGERHDYSRKTKALFSAMYVPENAPEWCEDRAEFWNRVEEKENRSNSQFCREYEVALQDELSLEQNFNCVYEFVKKNFNSKGLVADVAIHPPHKNREGESNKNIHAHILVSTRKVDENGWAEKFRADGLEQFKGLNGQKAEKLYLEELRKDWADTVNHQFRKLGIDAHIDHRTLEEQGIDREPQQHQGKAATAMERRGKTPDRKKYRRKSPPIEIDEASISTVETRKIDKEIEQLQAMKNDILEAMKQTKAEKSPEARKLTDLEKAEALIEKMTPKEWAKFIKYEDKAEVYQFDALGDFAKMKIRATQQSRIEYLKEHIDDITQTFLDDFKTKKNRLEAHDRKKPKIAEKPNAIKKFMYTYTTDDGKNLPYDQYTQRQKQLQSEWKIDREPIYNEALKAQERYRHATEKDFKSLYVDCQAHPNLWEKIKAGAKNIYETSPIFAPVRAIASAVEKFRSKKNDELKEWRKQQKTLQNEQEKGYGRGY